jgi:hypothetical protein
MTISTTTSRISYNGNGVTTVFSFPYRFLTNGDLVVLSVSAAGVGLAEPAPPAMRKRPVLQLIRDWRKAA